jgi:hypothetical protein
MKDDDYLRAHEDLAPEFALARSVITARVAADLTQEQLTIQRLADATGTRLNITSEPTT